MQINRLISDKLVTLDGVFVKIAVNDRAKEREALWLPKFV